jgi:hypothetical protein
MSEAVPAEQAAVAGKKRSLLRRIPTSLIVTLLGIALTAWLLPAFTRQWDDRQKARELKATTITDLSSAVAEAYVDSGRVLYATTADASRPNTQAQHQLQDQWDLARTRLEAQIRAYFPSVSRNFDQFATIVSRLPLIASWPGRPSGDYILWTRKLDGLRMSDKTYVAIRRSLAAPGNSDRARDERSVGWAMFVRLILDRQDRLDPVATAPMPITTGRVEPCRPEQPMAVQEIVSIARGRARI